MAIKMNKRERIMVSLGVACVVLVVVYHISQGPLQAYRQVLADYDDAQYALAQARVWKADIVSARGAQEALDRHLAARGRQFDLFTFFNATLAESGLLERANISNVRAAGVGGVPAGDFVGVQLRLDGVSMEELIDFLHRVYASDNVILLSELSHLRPASDARGLDSQMTFFSPQG